MYIPNAVTMGTASFILTTLCFIVFSTSLVTAGVSCPDSWRPSESSKSCLRLFDVDTDWYTARENCQAEGGDLAKVIDQEMNDLIVDIYVDMKMGMYYSWIGLNDINEEGVYVWLDDEEEVTWTNWYNGFPDEYYRVDCVCIYLYQPGGRGEWMDDNCSEDLFMGYACELFPATLSTTTPAVTTQDQDPSVTSQSQPGVTGSSTTMDSAHNQTTSPLAIDVISTTSGNVSTNTDTAVGGLSNSAIIGVVTACLAVLLMAVVYAAVRSCKRTESDDSATFVKFSNGADASVNIA